MAQLLQPGDPLPPLVLKPPVQIRDFSGQYLLIVCADEPLRDVPSEIAVLHVSAVNDPLGVTARRLGVMEPGEFLAILVDPAGTVLQSWAGLGQSPQIRTVLNTLTR